MAEKPLVPCSVCGGIYQQNKDGTVRVHGEHTRSVWPPMNCAGSRQPPKEM